MLIGFISGDPLKFNPLLSSSSSSPILKSSGSITIAGVHWFSIDTDDLLLLLRLVQVLAMAFTMRCVKVPPNSSSLEEARKRTFDFFRSACRSLPTVMEIYNLHDVATVSQLRSSIAGQIRKNAKITNPKVIDMLLFKGEEELNNVVEHAKQRHHIIGQYVVGEEGLVQDLGTKDLDASKFLKNFYSTNYF